MFVVLHSPRARAWGNEGHRLINRAAATSLPAEVPAFLRTETALNEIEYLGPEPDRWRSPAEAELSAAQAPEHFINLEFADPLGPLPHNRLDFEQMVFAIGDKPERVGLLPWQASEVWERLKAAMRQYRFIQAHQGDTKPVEQVILFYAAWLGHYVADGSQPLHTTIQYNGWVGPNPNGYTTAHKIHSQFESDFVSRNVHLSDIQAEMTPAKVINGDVFDAFLAYLRRANSQVERVYQLEKAAGFVAEGSAESRAFTTERLAEGASMLRDMVYTAWLQSAKPVPDRYAGK
jgi:hypothetical protein